MRPRSSLSAIRPGGRVLGLAAIAVFGLGCAPTSGVEILSLSTLPGDSVQESISEGANPATESIDSSTFEPEPPVWEPFEETIDWSSIEVPVDYRNPEGERFDLFVTRHRALDPARRIGTLLVNPGGPGFGGSYLAVYAEQIFDAELLDRFDIVGWDPRGTGESSPAIDCISDYDKYFTEIDLTPESDADHEALVGIARSFADECVSNNPSIIDFVGTNNSARDIDTIRRALGEDQISYFGFSYGSELGATWATMFPDTVRAAVLDGASDPNADGIDESLQQVKGFESSVLTFLSECGIDPLCAFYNDGDPLGAFGALMESLDENPISPDPSNPNPDRPSVNRDVALTAVVQAMYSEELWPSLEVALADAQDGDGSGLLALHDSYYQRLADGTYGNDLEAFQAISCADTIDRPTVEEADAEGPLYHDAAPTLIPAGVAGGYFCTFFPPSIDPRITITGSGAGPIVVIGTTGDPATPFASTVRMAETLEDGRLVVVEANQHTGYGVNRCVMDAVNDYLIDLKAPDARLECGP